MTITDIRVRDVSIPRVYDTYCADPKQMQDDVDHTRSRYQIIELFTDTGQVGIGEVSDIARRMNPLPAADLQDLLSGCLHGGAIQNWRDLYRRADTALPTGWHPELRNLTLFGVEIALLDLVGKRYGVPVYELLGGRYHDHVVVSWVAFLRGDVPPEDELRALREEIEEKTGNGLRSFKLKVGEDHSRDLERVALVREIAGPDAYIKVDASGAWEEEESKQKVRDMAKAGADAGPCPYRIPHRHHRTCSGSRRRLLRRARTAPRRGRGERGGLPGRRCPAQPAAYPDRGDRRRSGTPGRRRLRHPVPLRKRSPETI
mgnify:CR=1 FL=1